MQKTVTGPLSLIFPVLFLLAIGAPSATAQHTETRDAGGGSKIVLHFDADNKVTETDTLGPNGELLEKNVIQPVPGSDVTNSLATAYWPNGKVKKHTENDYDNNTNFTGEFVQTFDESGKQIGGHRLTHNPHSGVYSCADWDTPSQSYKPVECPAGEESSGAPETVKKFTQAEVTEQLAQARQAPPPRQVGRPPVAPTTNDVAFILPAHLRAGERVSGSVARDPAAYENSPEVMVTRISLPFAASGAAATLDGWSVEVSGAPAQPAAGPIVFAAPKSQTLSVVFRPADHSGSPVSQTIPLPQSSAGAKHSTAYFAPATCVKGSLCIVRGAFSGDSTKIFAAFSERAAKIVAETPDTAYLAIPDAIDAGSRPLAIQEGAKLIAFPMVVTAFRLRPDRRDLPAGAKLLMYATVAGPEELPGPEWRPGAFPPSILEEARKLAPGIPLSSSADHEMREAKEKREKEEKRSGTDADHDEGEEGGEVLLIVKNPTPDAVNFRDSNHGTYVFHLHAASFGMGEYTYKFLVEAKQTGTFGVQGFIVPLLAPVTGQEFTTALAK